MTTLTVQWKDIVTGKWDGGQVKRFRYSNRIEAAAAAKRFTAVSWVRIVE